MAVRRDGSGDTPLSRSSVISSNSAFTLSGWINRRVDTANYEGIVWVGGVSGSDPTQYAGFEINNSDALVGGYRATDGSAGVNLVTPQSVNQWRFVAVSYSGSGNTTGLTFYSAPDGGSLTNHGAAASQVGFNHNGNLLLGDLWSGEWFNGSYVGLRLYSAALTSDEINLERFSILPTRASNLVGNWYLRTTSEITTDFSGNSNTLSGGSGWVDDSAKPIDLGSITVPAGAHPYIISSTQESGTSLGSSNAQPLPAGSAAGDLIIVPIVNDNTSTTNITVSTGWTLRNHVTQGSNVIKSAIALRVLDGTAGNNILSVTGAAQDYCTAPIRIPAGTHGVTNVSTEVFIADANGSSGNGTPPNLNTGSSNDYLWLAVNAIDATTSNTISGYPTNYTAERNVTSASSTSSCILAVAWRRLTASQTQPAAFANNSQEWIAYTIAVPPPAAPPVLNPAITRRRLLLG